MQRRGRRGDGERSRELASRSPQPTAGQQRITMKKQMKKIMYTYLYAHIYRHTPMSTYSLSPPLNWRAWKSRRLSTTKLCRQCPHSGRITRLAESPARKRGSSVKTCCCASGAHRWTLNFNTPHRRRVLCLIIAYMVESWEQATPKVMSCDAAPTRDVIMTARDATWMLSGPRNSTKHPHVTLMPSSRTPPIIAPPTQSLEHPSMNALPKPKACGTY